MVARVAGISGWEAAVAHEVGNTINITTQPGQFTINLPCSVCCSPKEFIIHRALPPNVIRQKLIQRGWRVGRRLVCPACVNTRPAATKVIRYDDTRNTAEQAMNRLPASQRLQAPTPQPQAPESVVLHMPTGEKALKGLSSVGKLLSGVSKTEMELASFDKEDVTNALLTRVHDMASSDLKKSPAERAAARATELHRTAAPKVRTAPARKPRTPKVTPAKQVTPPPVQKEAAVNAPVLRVVDTAPAEAPKGQEPTAAAKRAHRAMMLLLEDEFNVETGRYNKEGWNDERVARESGAPVQHVRAERDKWFAKLKEPDEAETLRVKLLLLEDELAKGKQSLAVSMERLIRESEQTLAGLNRQVTDMRKELDAVARRKGWNT